MSDDTSLPRFDERAADDASAAVDGDLAAAGRADPRLLATMRALRAELAAVSPPSEDVRRQALASALAALPGSPVRLEAVRARRPQRWLLGAAAAALVIVAGVALATGGDSDSDDQLSQAPAEAETPVEDAGVLAAAETTGSEEATADAGADSATTIAVAAASPTIASSGETSSPSTGGSDGRDVPALDGPAEVLPMIDSPAALASYASAAAARTSTPAAPVTLPPNCVSDADENSTVLGMITYQGRQALVVAAADGEVIRALAVDDCAVLAEVHAA